MNISEELIAFFRTFAADPLIRGMISIVLIGVFFSIFPSIGRLLIFLLEIIGELFLLLGRLVFRRLGRRRDDNSGIEPEFPREPPKAQRRASSSGSAGTAPDQSQEPSMEQRKAGEDAEQQVQMKLHELGSQLINGPSTRSSSWPTRAQRSTSPATRPKLTRLRKMS